MGVSKDNHFTVCMGGVKSKLQPSLKKKELNELVLETNCRLFATS